MSQEPAHSKKGISTLFFAIVVFITVSFLVSLAFFTFKNKSFLSNNLSWKAKPVSTPNSLPAPRPIDHGKQIYNVSRGQGSTGPNMSQIIFDPMDPKIGENQKLVVKAQNTTPVLSIILTLKTDHKTSTYPLLLKEDTAANGTWEASWKVDDTYDYLYVYTIEAADAKEKTKLEYPWR